MLDTGASHLEVKFFLEALETYIIAGFRGQVPKSGVWIYIATFLSSCWWASMKSREVQDKSLKEILLENSALLCPVHQRCMEFLRERRGNFTHSEFLQRLEERIELIELESLTKQSLVSHIFMENSDLEMTRTTTDILVKTPGGNLDELRTSVKTTESSSWYKPGGKERANRVTQFWGACFNCNLFVHKAAHCKNPKKELPGA